ncbi:hypothetical protein K466DRAFT_375122 [Polyporus arcularius HHB13444]|uniref:Uncharacterized protein n=1 Tax=Polyporus arcularius HHB13444 TaxID=1314778 RepID=A0A5C3NSM6_9APHY|nr:hypothetical protein K466DRAFT_375122 [Polyporus arcularius HHB13444]
MLITGKRAFGPWGGFTPPFGWGVGGEKTTEKTTSTTNPPAQTQTQTHTQTQIQTSVITSVTDVTSVASATVVTTIIDNPTPTTISPTSPVSPSSSTSNSAPSARTPPLTSPAHPSSDLTASVSDSLSSHPTSVSSAADHDATSATGSETGMSSVAYVTLSLSGSTVTLLSTFGPQSHPTVAANAGQSGGHGGMSKGEVAALVSACIAVFVLSLVLCYVWRKRRRVRLAERDIHSPTHTISNGMVQAPHSDAVAFGTRGSTSTSAHNSVMSSRFSTSDEGHGNGNESRDGEGRPSVSGGRTLIGASSENEKSSATSRTSTSSPSAEAETEETPRSSTFLLHPQPSLPSAPAPAGASHLTPPPRTASASPRLLPVPPMSPLMEPGPPGLAGQTRVSASPYAPYAYAWAVQSPTTAASEYLPYAWDNPPPSSEYLPGSSSRRTTFTSHFRASRGADAGVPPYPSSPGFGGFGEDGRSERSAPPMYTPTFE